jgi:hypothetical protein
VLRPFAALAATVPLVLLAPAAALAAEVPNVGGKPLLVDVTNTGIFNYHFDNRDFKPGNVATEANDNYAEWLDRFNLQLSWWRLRTGVRLDGAAFARTLSPSSIDALVADKIFTGNPQEVAVQRNDLKNQFYRELHSRYLRSFYPSKLFVGYGQPGLDITVGDFYAQLGRGLVFSVRKIDELAIDTTVRGVKVVADHDFGSFRLSGTLFAGQMNPLRVDEATGRRLHGDGSALFFGFPQAGDLGTYAFDSDTGKPIKVIDAARPSYLEDTVLGFHLEGGTRLFTLGANTSVLARKSHTEEYLRCLQEGSDRTQTPGTLTQGLCSSQFPDFSLTDESKLHNTILTYSGSLTIPSIAKHGDVYLEVAGQNLRDGHLGSLATDGMPADKTPDRSGYAVYASGSFSGGPVSVSAELKHYRRFFPLSANIDTDSKAFGAPEYSVISYNSVPTVEPIYTEQIGSPNICITGGRGRVDYRFDRETSVYAWVGRYTSWSELDARNVECTISREKETRTWDLAVGLDKGFEAGKSHARAWVGARTTDLVAPENPNPDAVYTFYREGYLRYDIVKHISGPFSIQVQGFHRRRYEPVNFAAVEAAEAPWTEGENYTALQWSPHLSAVVGYEYKVKDGCQAEVPATLSKPRQDARDVCHFVNGGIQWRSHQGEEGSPLTRTLGRLFDTVAVFVGQRRGAVRCVSGVCRQFPPFEGAKLEITSRF